MTGGFLSTCSASKVSLHVYKQMKNKYKSNSKNFEILIITNCYPVWLSSAPLYLIDFSLRGGICQDRVFYCSRHLLNVPYQGLVIIAYNRIS